MNYKLRRLARAFPTSQRIIPSMDNREPVALEVRDTGLYGRGVFAVADISPGRMIHVLAGDTITSAELVHMVNSGREPIDDPLQVGMQTYITLEDLSRSFNRSCNPNAGLRKRSELFWFRKLSRDSW
jgi:hypothetical protein